MMFLENFFTSGTKSLHLQMQEAPCTIHDESFRTLDVMIVCSFLALTAGATICWPWTHARVHRTMTSKLSTSLPALSRSSCNPTQHHTKHGRTHIHTCNRLSFAEARSTVAYSLPQSDSSSLVELSCAFYWQTVKIQLNSMKREGNDPRQALIHLAFWWSQWRSDVAVQALI